MGLHCHAEWRAKPLLLLRISPAWKTWQRQTLQPIFVGKRRKKVLMNWHQATFGLDPFAPEFVPNFARAPGNYIFFNLMYHLHIQFQSAFLLCVLAVCKLPVADENALDCKIVGRGKLIDQKTQCEQKRSQIERVNQPLRSYPSFRFRTRPAFDFFSGDGDDDA